MCYFEFHSCRDFTRELFIIDAAWGYGYNCGLLEKFLPFADNYYGFIFTFIMDGLGLINYWCLDMNIYNKLYVSACTDAERFIHMSNSIHFFLIENKK